MRIPTFTHSLDAIRGTCHIFEGCTVTFPVLVESLWCQQKQLPPRSLMTTAIPGSVEMFLHQVESRSCETGHFPTINICSIKSGHFLTAPKATFACKYPLAKGIGNSESHLLLQVRECGPRLPPQSLLTVRLLVHLCLIS